MKKIFNCLNAEKARKYIGKEGLFFDNKYQGEEAPQRGILLEINEDYHMMRFRCDETRASYAFFEPTTL